MPLFDSISCLFQVPDLVHGQQIVTAASVTGEARTNHRSAANSNQHRKVFGYKRNPSRGGKGNSPYFSEMNLTNQHGVHSDYGCVATALAMAMDSAGNRQHRHYTPQQLIDRSPALKNWDGQSGTYAEDYEPFIKKQGFDFNDTAAYGQNALHDLKHALKYAPVVGMGFSLGNTDGHLVPHNAPGGGYPHAIEIYGVDKHNNVYFNNPWIPRQDGSAPTGEEKHAHLPWNQFKKLWGATDPGVFDYVQIRTGEDANRIGWK